MKGEVRAVALGRVIWKETVSHLRCKAEKKEVGEKLQKRIFFYS